ncbi:MAG: histidine kinase, partial [Anaerolineae bacterium]|nr:histidine kinase [Anaerolineae bacterium]
MAAKDTNLIADRVTIAVRWFAVLVITLQLATAGGISPIVYAFIILAGLWNFALTGVSLFQQRLPNHDDVNIVTDFVMVELLFLLSGGPEGVLTWAGLLPVVMAAFYYGFQGGLSMAGVVILTQTVFGFFYIDWQSNLAGMLPVAAIYLAAGAVTGISSQQIGIQLHRWQGLKEKSAEEADEGGSEEGAATAVDEEERLNTILRILMTLNTSLNYKKILDLALDLSAEAMIDPEEGEDRLVSAFLLYDASGLYVGSARRFTPADLRAVVPGNEGAIAQAINNADIAISEDPAHDPELSHFVAMRSCQTALCYPLRSGIDVYGLLIFGHPEAGYFTEEREEVIEIVGRQAQIALINAKLYRELEDEKERMMEIQEEARKRLARNLHDGPTQSVAAIAMRVNFARRLIDRNMEGAAEELYKIENLARKTTKEIRHMLFTLRPLVLESSGLKAALESMAAKMRETYDQNVIIDVDLEAVEQVDMSKQGVVFYIAEEAVNNARKHAEAEHIWVRLKPDQEDLVVLVIEDDGVGFDIGAV